MKKILTWALIFIFICLILKGCIKRDITKNYPQVNHQENNVLASQQFKNKNVTIDGIDFIQSLAPIGIFGGELFISTIGEGPKTFNPCTTKDATSSSMAGIMYDGLLRTNPYTGEIEPLLAKSYKVVGNEYIIELRKGHTRQWIVLQYCSCSNTNHWKRSTGAYSRTTS